VNDCANVGRFRLRSERLVDAGEVHALEENLALVGLGAVLSVALMERRGSTAASPQVAGLAVQMSPKSALSAVVGTAIGGAANSLNEVTLLGDLDGREDLVADLR
jgi:hypothetical protein